jgi:hypothetical protein
MTMVGWAWDVLPTVNLYAGDKAEIPTSGTPKTKRISGDAERWAGGWDIDRIFVDFGSADYLTAFWNAAVAQYKVDSDAHVGATVTAAAFNAGSMPAATTVQAFLKRLINDGRAVRGGKINRVALDDTLWDELTDIPTENLPLWLAKATLNVAPADGTAQVDSLVIWNDSTLPARSAVYFDNRALSVREKSPIQVKSVDIAHAGVDLGFYSYGGVLITDPRLVLKRTRAAGS